MVVVDGVLSVIAIVLSGVPQGTVLGPLLFLIFVNDIADCIKHSEISSFADDTRLSKAISVYEDCKYLQKDIDSVTKWANANNMALHDDKFIYINYNTRRKNFSLANLPFYNQFFHYSTLSGKDLECSEEVKDLGVVFTPQFSWSNHCSTIAKAAKRKTGWILSIFKDRTPHTMLILYKSLIRSLLEYACPLWLGLSVTDIQQLEAIQRVFTNKIICPDGVNDYYARLSALNLMSVQRRRDTCNTSHVESPQ